MISNNFTTKKEMAQNLKVSIRTFQRRLAANDLDVPRGLISPKKQIEIYKALGVELKSNIFSD